MMAIAQQNFTYVALVSFPRWSDRRRLSHSRSTFGKLAFHLGKVYVPPLERLLFAAGQSCSGEEIYVGGAVPDGKYPRSLLVASW